MNNSLIISDGLDFDLQFWTPITPTPLGDIHKAILQGHSSVRAIWKDPYLLTGANGIRLAQLKRDVATQAALVAGMPLQTWEVVWERSTPDMLAVSVIPFGRPVSIDEIKDAKKKQAALERLAAIDPIIPVPICPLTDNYISILNQIVIHCLGWEAGTSYQTQQNWAAYLRELIKRAAKALDGMNISREGKRAAIRAMNYLLVIPQEVIS